jgi:hypothetical protein
MTSPPFKKVSSAERQADRDLFESKVSDSLSDRSVKGFFDRGLVQRDDVIDALVNGPAFGQAVERDSYWPFANTRRDLQKAKRQISAVILNGALNPRPIAALVGIFLLITSVIVTITNTSPASAGITFIATISASISAWSFARARTQPERRLRRAVVSFLTISTSICALILPHTLFHFSWKPFGQFATWAITLTVFYFLSNEQTITQLLGLLFVSWKKSTLFLLARDEGSRREEWLADCVEDIIMPHATLAINAMLGEDKDLLLVEQDSNGLRKLQDLSFTVSTLSERRIANALAQMDGGSIAIAGPRGAGKSTLLKNFSGPSRIELSRAACVSVYLTAPAEYVPRDFIAELFQKLCEAYLEYEDCSLPEPIYREHAKVNSRHALRRILAILWLCLRTAIIIALILWIARPITHSLLSANYYRHIYISLKMALKRWWHVHGPKSVQEQLYKPLKPYWVWIKILAVIVALFSLPALARWRQYIRPYKEPELASKARAYLLRLQVDKTVSRGTSLNSPNVRGLSLSMNKGETASYTPWSLPELVGYTRGFMQAIADRFKRSSYAVIVGIDEIDRIGSLDHAERFVGEIKAVFGVEKCFFLVAVAEDVGSVFAQRATAGRSILENAFDDIVVVEPLSFLETRDLLLKRVPGFTDSFVYLVHALSGGLPRELIRVTRRLVEVNQEMNNIDRPARLQDLTFALVSEQVSEAIRATRNQLSRLALHPNWVVIFDKLLSASTTLRYGPISSTHKSYGLIKELSELQIPDTPKASDTRRILALRDEDHARRILEGFTAFCYFGITVIDAFSDKFFDFSAVQQSTAGGSEDSYEELAVARAELSVSPENSRVMLRRFQNSLTTHEAT